MRAGHYAPKNKVLAESRDGAEAGGVEPLMNRKASVVWKGNFQEGTGTMSTESQVLSDTQYSFRTRFAKASAPIPTN